MLIMKIAFVIKDKVYSKIVQFGEYDFYGFGISNTALAVVQCCGLCLYYTMDGCYGYLGTPLGS